MAKDRSRPVLVRDVDKSKSEGALLGTHLGTQKASGNKVGTHVGTQKLEITSCKTTQKFDPDIDLSEIIIRPHQELIWNHLCDQGAHETTVPEIARILGLNDKQVRRAIDKFSDQRILRKEYDPKKPSKQKLTPLAPKFNSGHNKWVPTSGQIDRSNNTLSNLNRFVNMTSSEFRTYFPQLYERIGFGPSQVKEIIKARANAGDPIEDLVESLEHAEWELETCGHISLDNGQLADEPAGYLFSRLKKVGGYKPAPKGYVSMKVRALQDKKQRLDQECEALLEKEKAAFGLWIQKLSTKEKESIKRQVLKERKKQGNNSVSEDFLGPESQWLFAYWREHIKDDENYYQEEI